MFEQASRLKLRFDHRGQLSVEDLWDLTERELDSIYKKLNAESKAADEESLMETRSREDKVLSLKIEVVKHIFSVKSAEKEERRNLAERKAKKERLMELVAKKQDAELEGKTLEELQGMINEL